MITIKYNSNQEIWKSNVDSDRFWIDKAFANSIYDCIIIGDSRVYRGISPNILNHNLNIKVLNFGFSSAGLTKEYLEFAESKINNYSNNKIIILGVSPYSLTKKATKNYHLKEILDYPIDYKLAVKYCPEVVFLFSPIEIKNLFGSIKRNNYIQEYNPNGWVASGFIKEDSIINIQNYKEDFTDNYVINEIVDEICETITIWCKKDIHVFAFRMVCSDEMFRLENTYSQYNPEKISNSITAAGATWFEFPNEGYHSYDGSHLNKTSALAFSTKLSDIIAKHIEKENIK